MKFTSLACVTLLSSFHCANGASLRSDDGQRKLAGDETGHALIYVGKNGIPAEAFPLGECEGDCDTDDDCEGRLVCFQRDGGEPVPGCEGNSRSRTDFCSKPVYSVMQPRDGENPCDAADPKLANIQCLIDDVVLATEQAGGNVTKGYQGKFETAAEPLTITYFEGGLCPVNVHWHLGTEHISEGEYDLYGTGPSDIHERRKLAGKVQIGGQCSLYDENEEMYTKEYDWKHCVDMEVGQTYEMHWPHSRGGACGTVDQYQTPFKDGIFCNSDKLTGPLPYAVGVQAQIYTIVNDDSYYYPDMIRGMTVDGDMGVDIAYYTGSSTGTSVNNEICSQYSPITWQVDRKCHKISASAIDKLCADMKGQRDDMAGDLYPHGSRAIVADHLAANNQVR